LKGASNLSTNKFTSDSRLSKLIKNQKMNIRGEKISGKNKKFISYLNCNLESKEKLRNSKLVSLET